MATVVIPWKPWKKFGFRFVFLFFSIISVLCLQLITYITWLAFDKQGFDLDTMFKPLSGVIHWLDRYIFHIGYDPKLHSASPGDTHFGMAFYLTVILLSLLIAITWSALDRNRSNYDRLYYWFCLYLRYVIGITIITYGIDKVIPVQMPHPSPAMLTEPYGNTNRFNILWGFMGTSPGYMFFTGAFEIIGGLMLFFRRTMVAGCLLIVVILTNVVALNWFYNVGVKFFSTQLLVFTLFLLGPFLKTIFGFFFGHACTTLNPPPRFAFQTKWKRYLLTTILSSVTLALISLNLAVDYKSYNEQAENERKQKAYDVTAFVAKDTLPPLTTDTLHWKRVLMFVYGHYFIVYNMQDKGKWYKFKADSSQKIFTLEDGADKKKWRVFHYAYPAKDQMQLSGQWNGKDINVSLKLSPLDSIPLNKERIKFYDE